MIDRSRLAGYLDEAGDDPVQGVETLKSHGIAAACIRQLWTGNVLEVSDQALRRTKAMLDAAGIKAVMIWTSLGDVPPEELSGISPERLERPFLTASYFGATYVRLCVGKSGGPEGPVLEWMDRVQQRAIAANAVPLLELTHDQPGYEPATAARFLRACPRWRLLYDPAQLVLQRRLDPFVRYWTLLKDRVAAIDLHDLKIGHNFRPPGQGDCGLARTLRDAAESKYSGWYFLEPGLGRRYGPALRRQDTFALALEALQLLEQS